MDFSSLKRSRAKVFQRQLDSKLQELEQRIVDLEKKKAPKKVKKEV